jgi:REP element-mobilizing transposase RayT
MVLKSTGNSYFKPGHRELESILCHHAKRYKIQIYRISLNWSHMHIILKLPSRASYRAFFKTVTAALVTHLSKQTGKCLKGLFDLRPYTRVLTTWGREFRTLLNYHDLNDLEAWGLNSRKKSAGKAKAAKAGASRFETREGH